MSTSDPDWSTPVEAHAARTDEVVLVLQRADGDGTTDQVDAGAFLDRDRDC